MGSFIARQPNGLLCRFSSVVDGVTDYNMTDDEYIEMCAERAREEAQEVLAKHLKPYQRVKDDFRPGNESQEEFEALLKEMETPVRQEVTIKDLKRGDRFKFNDKVYLVKRKYLDDDQPLIAYDETQLLGRQDFYNQDRIIQKLSSKTR